MIDRPLDGIKIFVEIEKVGEYALPKFVKARFVDRSIGKTIYRYLQYRHGEKVKNIYVGKLIR